MQFIINLELTNCSLTHTHTLSRFCWTVIDIFLEIAFGFQFTRKLDSIPKQTSEIKSAKYMEMTNEKERERV